MIPARGKRKRSHPGIATLSGCVSHALGGVMGKHLETARRRFYEFAP